MPKNILARALSFSHLSGVAGKKADDKKDDKDMEVEDEEKKDQDREDGDARRAEDDGKDKDKDAAASDDKDDGKDENKGKRGKAADDDEECEDDDSDEEMRGKSAEASARRRERARCAAIFASDHATGNVQLAATLAFNTTLTRKEALAVLRDTPPPRQSNAARQDRNPKVGAGGTLTANSSTAIASRWDAHFKKARGR